MINFPFGTNGKLIILGVPILRHITVYTSYSIVLFQKMSDLMYFRNGQVIKLLGVSSAPVMCIILNV